MSETELCRLCTNMADQNMAEKLFERNQRKLLRQIEELIGQRLKNAKDLPQHICKPCEEQTVQAHSFRERCIRAQQHFAVQKKTMNQQQKNNELKTELPPIEEVVLTELDTVKMENHEDASPPQRVLKLPLKHENTDLDDDFNADDSEDSFNPLDESFQHTTDEEDMMTIEPEISFFADEEYFPNKKKKLKTEKIEKEKPEQKKKSSSSKQESSSATKEKSFICDQCGRHANSRSALEIHLRRHTGERPFKCEICPESFILNSDLKVHILKHTDVLPYPCSICDRRFSYKSNARKHERKHTNERPHVCPQCGKGFTVPDTLKAHMVVHTGERAFVCKMCNMAFKRKTHLITHYRSMTHKQNEEKQQLNTDN